MEGGPLGGGEPAAVIGCGRGRWQGSGASRQSWRSWREASGGRWLRIRRRELPKPRRTTVVGKPADW